MMCGSAMRDKIMRLLEEDRADSQGRSIQDDNISSFSDEAWSARTKMRCRDQQSWTDINEIFADLQCVNRVCA